MKELTYEIKLKSHPDLLKEMFETDIYRKWTLQPDENPDFIDKVELGNILSFCDANNSGLVTKVVEYDGKTKLKLKYIKEVYESNSRDVNDGLEYNEAYFITQTLDQTILNIKGFVSEDYADDVDNLWQEIVKNFVSVFDK